MARRRVSLASAVTVVALCAMPAVAAGALTPSPNPLPGSSFQGADGDQANGGGFIDWEALGGRTRAYSALSDWPGGGVIGIHGTNQPWLIPGRPSHGCVRVPNPAIVRLARIMPIGTPILIR